MFGALHLLAGGCAIIIPVQLSEQRAGRTVIEHHNKTEFNDADYGPYPANASTCVRPESRAMDSRRDPNPARLC